LADLRIAAAVLAAGQSRRFGADDKLAASFNGLRLGELVPATLAGLGFAERWVITRRDDHPCAPGWRKAGFAVAINERAAEGMGQSLALAARLARAAGADALLVALADMPIVPANHFAALLARAASAGPQAILASQAGSHRSPPALFGRDQFGELAEAAGDHGARHLLARAEPVDCPPDWLSDIDEPADLARLAPR